MKQTWSLSEFSCMPDLTLKELNNLTFPPRANGTGKRTKGVKITIKIFFKVFRVFSTVFILTQY